jgi:hypothetical protein
MISAEHDLPYEKHFWVQSAVMRNRCWWLRPQRLIETI